QTAARVPAQGAVEPPLEELAHPRLAAPRRQRGADDRGDELLPRLPEDLELEGLLGTEVREESGLAHPGGAGELADGQAAEADAVGRLDPVHQNAVPRGGSLGHGDKIVRPCDLGKWVPVPTHSSPPWWPGESTCRSRSFSSPSRNSSTRSGSRRRRNVSSWLTTRTAPR